MVEKEKIIRVTINGIETFISERLYLSLLSEQEKKKYLRTLEQKVRDSKRATSVWEKKN